MGEPTECALVNDAAQNGLPKTQLKEEYVRVGEAPFDSMRKMMLTVHKTKENKIIQFTKGAPDEVLKMLYSCSGKRSKGSYDRRDQGFYSEKQ